MMSLIIFHIEIIDSYRYNFRRNQKDRYQSLNAYSVRPFPNTYTDVCSTKSLAVKPSAKLLAVTLDFWVSKATW